jgi:hypothetical protein
MTIRRQTAEHPFGTIKCWMGATHFLTKRLPKVASEMALNVLAYNMKRVMAIIGVAALLEALGRLSRGIPRVQINASRCPRVRLGRSGSRFCSDRCSMIAKPASH